MEAEERMKTSQEWRDLFAEKLAQVEGDDFAAKIERQSFRAIIHQIDEELAEPDERHAG